MLEKYLRKHGEGFQNILREYLKICFLEFVHKYLQNVIQYFISLGTHIYMNLVIDINEIFLPSN